MPNKHGEKLALGLFMPNCSNMPSISTHRVVEDQWTYEHNESLALLAEGYGFKYLFPVFCLIVLIRSKWNLIR